MDYDVFKNAYTERFGSNAPMILSSQNIRNQDGQLISHTILKNCADSIGTSPFPELRADFAQIIIFLITNIPNESRIPLPDVVRRFLLKI